MYNNKAAAGRVRYSPETKRRAVKMVEKLIKQGESGFYSKVARDIGVTHTTITSWHKASLRNGRRSTNGYAAPEILADEQTEAQNEARGLSEVMEAEAVTDHTSGGIHPLLTAYEDAAEKFDHQRTVVETLNAELTVHSERLAELEQSRDDAKKALQELVNSL